MSAAFHSLSSQHKQAARDHELAALQHRTAAEFHDKRMLHAARLSAADATLGAAPNSLGSELVLACAKRIARYFVPRKNGLARRSLLLSQISPEPRELAVGKQDLEPCLAASVL
jgi:hypothetical protein